MLVVLVILGILASVATFYYRGWNNAGSEVQCQDNMKAIRAQMKVYFIRNDAYPASANLQTFLENPTYFSEKPTCPKSGVYTLSAADENGVPTITCSIHGSQHE